jgi:hypothetical protein
MSPSPTSVRTSLSAASSNEIGNPFEPRSAQCWSVCRVLQRFLVRNMSAADRRVRQKRHRTLDMSRIVPAAVEIATRVLGAILHATTPPEPWPG